MRDFIHIEDCIDGILATMDAVDDGDAVNLSTGVLTSFLDFARTAAEILGYRPVVRGLSEKPSGVFARGGDTSKQHALGFRHRIDFRDGIERALSYLADGRERREAPLAAPPNAMSHADDVNVR